MTVRKGRLPTLSLPSLCIIIFLVQVSSTAKAGNEELYGTWRLVSDTNTFVATGESVDVFGKSPHGFINYSPGGRVLVLIVSDKRPKPLDLAKMTDEEKIELFKTMIAYGGTYTYDGKTVTHHIDISWNQNWTGTDGVRQVKLDGNRLILSTLPQPRPLDGKLVTAVLTWERVK